MKVGSLYTPVSIAPTTEELRSILGDRAYPACEATRNFIHANYKAEERWRYSDRRDSFDCLFYDGDKKLCSLHLHEGTFSILLLLSAAECDAFIANKDEFSEEACVYFRSAAFYNGEKWVRAILEDNAPLKAILPLIRLKAELEGMNGFSEDTIHTGDDKK